jgi:hypothetical protein
MSYFYIHLSGFEEFGKVCSGQQGLQQFAKPQITLLRRL